MLAFLQSFGSMPVFNDWVNMACNTCAIAVAVSFKTLFSMLSGPDNLLTFKSLRSFSTPPDMISRIGMSGNLTSVHSGMVDVFSCVKTLWNCLLISSALSLFSLCSLHFDV